MKSSLLSVLLGGTLAAGMIAGGMGSAAEVAAQGAQPPAVVSPEVNANDTVTLRLHAPEADEVSVVGEILDGSDPVAMKKGNDGVWTATLGPLTPDVYIYGFVVDGVRITDPRNPWVKLVSGTNLASQVQVPADADDDLAYYDAKDVPHGLVHIMTYHSESLDATRQAYVYTPPGYEDSDETYPVFYLLHGGGDLDPGWVMTGRANFILDNLIAEGEAVPMVVVMPNAHTRGSLGVGPQGFSPGVNPAPNAAGGGGRGGGAAQTGPAPLGGFAQDFFNDLMPAVEETFRVSTDADGRGIGGLSMGGGATINTAFSRPEMFSHVVIMSAGGGQNLVQSYPKFFGDDAAAAKDMELIWVAVGDEDFALEGSKAIDAALTEHDIDHEFHITEGRHEWRIWREHLRMFAPLLFED